MERMLAAEAAVFIHLQTVRVILLILLRVVVALLAVTTCQSNFYAHFRHLLIVRIFLPPSFLVGFAALSNVFFAYKKRALHER